MHYLVGLFQDPSNPNVKNGPIQFLCLFDKHPRRRKSHKKCNFPKAFKIDSNLWHTHFSHPHLLSMLSFFLSFFLSYFLYLSLSLYLYLCIFLSFFLSCMLTHTYNSYIAQIHKKTKYFLNGFDDKNSYIDEQQGKYV